MFEIDKQISNLQNRALDLNEQEALFELNITDYKLKDLYKNFENYKNLWYTTKDWSYN